MQSFPASHFGFYLRLFVVFISRVRPRVPGVAPCIGSTGAGAGEGESVCMRLTRAVCWCLDSFARLPICLFLLSYVYMFLPVTLSASLPKYLLV